MAREFEGMAEALQIPASVLNKLDKVDEKINKIATDSENMAKAFQSAMTRMGTGVDGLLKKLQAMQPTINKLDISKFAQGVQNVGRGTTQVEQFAAAIAKAAAAINKYNAENRKRTDVDNSKQIAQLNKEIEAMRKRTQQLEEYINKQRQVNQGGGRRGGGSSSTGINSDTKALNAYNRAMAASEALVTQRINKIAKLRQAEEMLRNASGNYATQLNRIRQEIARLNKLNEGQVDSYGRVVRSQKKLMNISQQLARQLALVFSVSSITGFINKMIQVRGEFELQQTALTSILDSKDKANELFAQITDLAVQSPYTIKELNSYTKQLAAYQIQYEDLYDTLKRLADVSSGLGVDMGRLILAFGQVKAANFLRGCLGYDTPVMLYDGTIKKVQDIKVGDVLINENGEAVNVLELIHGRETMYLVEQVSGKDRFSYRVNRNHILTLWNVQEQNLEDVYVYDYLKNTEAYLGLKIVGGKKVYYDIEVTKDKIDDYYGFVLDGNKRFRLGDGTVTHNTEVRQFTEAGLNILGELAKYYSELEGRMISVGEVQEMVSKRMVSFGDVEEVFKRVTSAGGMFYDMQLKQSQTLRGQMMNLQDQYDLMLNELGQSSQGMINDFISFVKSALENWETIAQVMRPILGFLGTYFLLTNKWFGLIPMGVKVWTALKTVLASIPPIQRMMNLQQQKFNKLTKTNMWLLVLGLIATAVWEVIEAFNAANKKTEEFNRIADEAHNDAKLSIAQYRRLANTVTDTTKTYQEQEAALRELQRVYQDILPDQYLQIDSIRALEGEYEGAEQAILNYMKARAQERQINFIEEEYGQNVQDTRNNLIEDIQSRVDKLYDITIPEIDLGYLIDKAEKEIEEGTIKDYMSFYDKLIELVSGYLDKEVEHLGLTETSLAYFNQVKGMYGAISNVLQGNTVGFGSQIEREMQTMRDDTQNVTDEMNRLLNVISHMDEVGADGVLITEKQVKEAKKNLAELLKNYGITIDEINKLTGDAWEIRDVIDKFTRAILKGLQNLFAKLKTSSLNGFGNILRGITDIDDEIKKMDNTPFQDYVEGMIEDAAKLEKIDLGRFVRYLPQDMETVDEFTKRIKNKIEQLESDITKYDKHPSLIQQWFGKPEERDKAERELNVLRIVLAGLVDEANKNRGRGTDPRLKQLEDNIKLLEDAYKRYKELNEELSDTESAQMTRNMFEGTPIGDVVATMTFDASGMIEGLQALYEQASKGVSTPLAKSMDDARKEASRPFETELLITPRVKAREEWEKTIDSFFDQYDLSVELMDTGLSKDLIQNLFDVDIFDLDTLKQKIQSLQPIFEKAGLNWEEVWEDAEERLTSKTEEELEKRLKKYAEYLAKATDQTLLVQKKTGFAITEATKLFNSGKLDAGQYATLLKTLISDMNNQISEINVEKFKDSAEYIRAMGDMTLYSKKQLEEMSRKIQELITTSAGNINAEDLKVYQEALEKINEQIRLFDAPLSNNPFAKVAELNDLQRQFNDLQQRQNDLLRERDAIQARLDDATKNLADLQARQKANPQENLLSEISDAQENMRVLTEESEKINGNIKKTEGEMGNVSAKAKEIAENMNISIAKLQNVVSGITGAIDNMNNLYQGISSLAESFGADTDEGAWASIGIAMDGLSEAGQNLQGAMASLMAGDPFGVAVGLFNVVGSIVKMFNNIHDNKRQQQIEKEQDIVEDLQRAYKKLEKAIDDAYSTDTLKSANQAALKNLDQQEASIKKMMALEQDKKDTDEDAIKEYQNQLDELEETRKQLIEEMQSTLTGGIFDDIISTAEQFTQAWLDAFNETGDGLKGLEENFDELLRTLLIRQAAMQVVSPLIEKMAEELKKYINVDDADFTTPEAEAWANYSKSLLEPMSESLKNMFTAWKNAGLDIFGSDELSGLQKGIQSITEETALALEALLNSIRFYVSDIRTVTRNMYSILFETPEMSPYYQQMLLQTQYLRSINDLVIATSTYSTNNGRVLKVKVV